MALKTDYKDDVFSGNRKYQKTDNSDGTISLVDKTAYSQKGDTFSAADINAINAAVNGLSYVATESTDGLMSAEDKKAIDKLNNFGLDGLTKYGYRLSSANDVPGSDGKLRYIIATDSMTEGKPIIEGCIIHMAWDNSYDWATQLFIPNIKSGHAQNRPMQFRGKDGDKHEWSKWISVYSENNPQTSTTKSFTLSANGWAYNSEYDMYFYRIDDSLITAASNQEIVPSSSANREQLKALQKANLVGGSQDNGIMYLWAYGTIPTIDIPIKVIFRGTI